MTTEEKMILAHKAGRTIRSVLEYDAAFDIRAEARRRYDTLDEADAFVAGYYGERIRYVNWLKARQNKAAAR